MSSNTNLIPSRDALRALRSLAFTPQAAFVGTVGSLCGLAVVHRYQYRQIQHAEKILETKRKIHILSGGRGNAHATRMFEAAERGDDFTLHHGRPRTPGGSKQYTAQAAEKDANEDIAFAPFAASLDDMPLATAQEPEPEQYSTQATESGTGNDLAFVPFANTSNDIPLVKAPERDKKVLTSVDDTLRRSSRGNAKRLEGVIYLPQSYLRSYQDEAPHARKISQQAQMMLDDAKPDEKQNRNLKSKSRSEAVQVLKPGQARFVMRDVKTASTPTAKPSWARKRLKTLKVNRWSAKVVTAAQDRLEKRWRISSNTELSDLTAPTRDTESFHPQQPTDLNPIPSKIKSGSIEYKDRTTRVLSPEESIFFNFVFDKPIPDSIFETDTFRTLCPWPESVATGNEDAIKTDEPQSFEKDIQGSADGRLEGLCDTQDNRDKSEDQVHVSSPNLAVRTLENAPSSQRHSVATADTISTEIQSDAPTVRFVSYAVPLRLTSQGLRLQAFAEQTFTSQYGLLGGPRITATRDGDVKYSYIFNSITRVLVKDGTTSALALLEDSLKTLVGTECSEDLSLAQALICDLVSHMDSQEFSATIRRAVRSLLAGQSPKLHAVSLLYPRPGTVVPQQPKKYYYHLVMRYMTEFCTDEPDLDEQESELRKIIAGTLLCEVPLHEMHIVPVLRALCRAGQVDRAQTLLDTIIDEHGLQTTMYSISELIYGHSLAGHWPKVKSIMDKAHDDGLSWRRMHGYANVFGGTIEQYATNYKSDRVVDFVKNCIENYGLSPTGTVSSRLLRVCLRDRRYDLVRDWIKMVHRDFPQLEVGTGFSTFAYEMASLWKEMSASCEEISAGCRALATDALRDPFSKVFRGIVTAALSRDLFRRIEAMEEVSGCKFPEYRTIRKLDPLISDIHKLITASLKIGAISRTRLLADDIIKQTKAVVDVERLLGGATSARNVKEWDDKFSSQTDSPSKKIPRMPHGLRAQRMPSLEDTISLVEKFYEGRQALNLPVDHSVLTYVIDRLRKSRRPGNALVIIEKIYNSTWAQQTTGTTFGADLFSDWLQLAYDVRSDTKIRDVLWHIVDAGSELRLTTDIILLARIAAPKSHASAMRSASNEEVNEVEYLRHRLRVRRWQQGGVHVKLPKWVGFGDING